MYICILKSEKFLFTYVFNYLYICFGPQNLGEVGEIK